MLRPRNAGELFSWVGERTGAAPDEARRASHAALELLGRWLSFPALRELASIRGFDVDLVSLGEDAPRTVDVLVSRMAARARTTPGHALEVAEVIGGLIVDICGERAWSDEMPQVLRSLVSGHEPAHAVPRPPPHPPSEHLDGGERTLAAGRPREGRPVAEAHALDRSSTIADGNPHAGSKLSSGR